MNNLTDFVSLKQHAKSTQMGALLTKLKDLIHKSMTDQQKIKNSSEDT